ncbi:MAG: GspH/FimT family pseudopilin [Zoogloeaceae bacterium]|jgi:type IV fimbrial biogenesis protein FimT|nr:GspH/FimT family pseudopilin [Zoogloeaceae bacterium]
MKHSCARAFRGFTIIELMVTIAIMAILTTIAVPSFRDMIMKNRVSAAASELVAAISLARTEAATRGTDVTLTAASVGGVVSWANGWKIEETGATITTIREHEPIPSVTATATPAVTTLTFNRLGGVDTATAIEITVDGCPAKFVGGKRTLEIKTNGRVLNEVNTRGDPTQLAKITCP